DVAPRWDLVDCQNVSPVDRGFQSLYGSLPPTRLVTSRSDSFSEIYFELVPWWQLPQDKTCRAKVDWRRQGRGSSGQQGAAHCQTQGSRRGRRGILSWREK